MLASNQGKLLTHRMLLQEVWGPGYGDESNLLHVNVSQLRRKIEPDRARPRYLLTEPGAGYRLVESEPRTPFLGCGRSRQGRSDDRVLRDERCIASGALRRRRSSRTPPTFRLSSGAPRRRFRPPSSVRACQAGTTMYDLAAIAIGLACFAFVFALALRAGAALMSAADAFGLVVSLAVLAYLVYALFRGERF